MQPKNLLLAALLSLVALSSQAADGLVSVKSPYSATETMDRLQALVKEKGLSVFARIDHAAGAAKIGKTLRPTELLIFGNPQGGTPFMECSQSVGIDLPLKALTWEDSSGQAWIGYNDPEYLAKRHEVPNCAVAANLKKALASFVEATVAEK
ncbi:MAG: DUF302 domain-containing protein [Burkholderiaceae bacterium]